LVAVLVAVELMVEMEALAVEQDSQVLQLEEEQAQVVKEMLVVVMVDLLPLLIQQVVVVVLVHQDKADNPIL
jgi:hypothetical protein